MMKNTRGFTLIEVLIVIGLIGILAAVAVPSITKMGRASAVRSEARKLKDQMARARMSAVELNMPILVAFNVPVGGKCDGFQIVEDANGNSEVDAGESSKTVTFSDVAITSNNFTLNTAGNKIIQWSPRGLPLKKDGTFTNGTITITGANNKQISIVLNTTGNIRIN